MHPHALFFTTLRQCLTGIALVALVAPATHAQLTSEQLQALQNAMAGSGATSQAQTPGRTAPLFSGKATASPTSTSPGPTVVPAMGGLPHTAAHTDVFGAQLFTGAFAREGATVFNPDYLVATGDTVQVRLWGAFEFDANLVVDPQGNVFVPNVGPVQVRGVRNAQLQETVTSAVGRIYKANVNSYASLAQAQPVRVFVSGFVVRPGLYSGTSMDSLLHYLDQAGGIDPDRGTYLNLQVKRGDQVRATINLYDFLLNGRMPQVQLGMGDVVFVPPRLATTKVQGLVANAKRFEFAGDTLPLLGLAALAKPQAAATHVRLTRNTGTVRNVEYHELAHAAHLAVGNGDEVEFTADKKPGTITVRVEGEHQSAQEYVLPYGSQLGELLQRIQLNDRSQIQNVQLFRLSVKQRQKDMLATSLRSLESALLTARSGSSDEARLRNEEAALTLQWVERAKQVEPLGQVLIAQADGRNQIMLENGDVLRIPTKDALVLVSGEVLFPNAVAYQANLGLDDYIRRAGGYTQQADNSRVVVARLDGSFEQAEDTRSLGRVRIQPGDQVLVLPKVDDKPRQFWKDMTQIIYQIAVSAKVVFGL